MKAMAAGLALGLWAITSAASAAEAPNFEFRGHKIGEDMRTAFPGGGCGKYDGRDTLLCPDAAKKVGDVPLLVLGYAYGNGRMFSVEMGFVASDFPKVREMLIGRYGQPAGETGNKASWNFAEGQLVLEHFAIGTEIGRLYFVNPAAEAALGPPGDKALQAQGRSAF